MGSCRESLPSKPLPRAWAGDSGDPSSAWGPGDRCATQQRGRASLHHSSDTDSTSISTVARITRAVCVLMATFKSLFETNPNKPSGIYMIKLELKDPSFCESNVDPVQGRPSLTKSHARMQ